jgi:nitrite reductase/ring-hydroxylating ferredoxin subunit
LLSFFDPNLLEKWGGAFIREDKIDESLARLIPNVRITKGHFSYPAPSETRDLLWNHMDQNHRPFIHRTYGDAMRVAIGERSAFSLTRFGKWPIVLPVFDGHFKENGFYQILCLFGVLVVVNIIECHGDGLDARMDVDWVIASHRFLRFLHGPLNRRLQNLNLVQNREDDEMRDRRVELRAAGYKFATDIPDFVNSNVVGNNVVFPPLRASKSVAVADIPEGKPQTIEVGDRAYVVRREGDSVDVWPGVCPHEGALLGPEDVSGKTVRCRWHGLEFPARRVGPGASGISICGARVELVDGTLNLGPVRPAAAGA